MVRNKGTGQSAAGFIGKNRRVDFDEFVIVEKITNGFNYARAFFKTLH